MRDRDIKLSLFFCLKKQKGSCENFREDSKGLILYKKEYPIEIGKIMWDKYEKGFIRSKNDFEETLKNVLSDCER